jgi:two-component system, NtrC family, response regulator GlrR
MNGARVLVVDDDPDLLALIGMRLTAAGYEVALAASGAEALETFRAERPRAVVTDLRMDGMDGHALFDRLHAEAPSVPVIILTAHGTIPDAVAATQRGVFGFLTKPFDGRELLARIAEAVALSPPIAADTGAETTWRANFVSVSPIMDELLRQARRAAESDDPLLISGPRGSGKEMLARVIHGASPRARKPFVIMRCGPQADDAGEDAAFGDALDAARGGTLFLDDVGEMAANVQTRLLPLVREISLFSAHTARARPMRIIAATVQGLDNAIRAGQFRADLFYSLNQTALTVPPLAERRDDIPLLAAHFAGRWAERTRGAVHGFAPDALTLLQEASFPGNVRQLRNVVEQLLGQCVTPLVPASLVRRVLRDDNEREMAAFDDARRAFEYDYLVDLLRTTAGNVAQAARIAQRNRTEFYKLLARHALDPATFKPVAK